MKYKFISGNQHWIITLWKWANNAGQWAGNATEIYDSEEFLMTQQQKLLWVLEVQSAFMEKKTQVKMISVFSSVTLSAFGALTFLREVFWGLNMNYCVCARKEHEMF